MKNIFITLILIALLTGGFFAARQIWRESREADQEWSTTAVSQRQTIEEAIEAGGFVNPVHSTDVRSEISGRITRILVEPGDKVERGQILIELDRVTLESELSEAERNHEAEALRLQRAQRDYARLKQLRSGDFVQEKEFLDAETDMKLAEIQLTVREAQLDKARENLSRTIIRAPQSGMVANLDVNEGQVITGATSVSEGTRLMTIHDLANLYVQLEVNELDINKLKLGMPAQVTFDAVAGSTFSGRVSQIHPFAVNQNNLRVFRVEVTFEPGEKLVRPGISANIRIVTDRVEDAVALTLSAIFTEGGKRFVYVVDDNGDVVRQPVQTGINNTRWVEIREGLDEGVTVTLTRPRQRSRDA